MKTIENKIITASSTQLHRYFEHPEEVLFFDIETTGFSPRSASIYLIGCACCTADGWRVRQYFAETPAEESAVVRAFVSFASSFSHFVHFNGLTFDVPFIQAKCKVHGLPAFTPPSQCDIYKCICPYKNMLHLPGCRQKQIEDFVGIHREDTFNGGQLIELYRAYTEEPDEQLLKVLLLHNHDDIAGMLSLYSVMAIPMLFEEGRFSVEEAEIADQVCADTSQAKELLLGLTADFSLPAAFTCHAGFGLPRECFLSGRSNRVLIKVPIFSGELKYFYPDYKNYSYLPAEDQAIHKSVAVYVDKSQRMPATAATCYTRKSGDFLPCFDVLPENLPVFRTEHKDKQKYILADETILENQELLKEYVKGILTKFQKMK